MIEVHAGFLPHRRRHGDAAACGDGDVKGQIENPCHGDGVADHIVQPPSVISGDGVGVVYHGAGDGLQQEFVGDAGQIALAVDPGVLLPADRRQLPEKLAEGGLPPGHYGGNAADLLFAGAVFIAPQCVLRYVVSEDDEHPGLFPSSVLLHEIAVPAVSRVLIPLHAVEAPGKDGGALRVYGEPHSQRGGAVLLRRRLRARELVHRHRLRQLLRRREGPGLIGPVRQQIPVVLPAVGRVQVVQPRITAVAAQDARKAPAVTSG